MTARFIVICIVVLGSLYCVAECISTLRDYFATRFKWEERK